MSKLKTRVVKTTDGYENERFHAQYSTVGWGVFRDWKEVPDLYVSKAHARLAAPPPKRVYKFSLEVAILAARLYEESMRELEKSKEKVVEVYYKIR